MDRSLRWLGTALLVLFLGMTSTGPAVAQAPVSVRLEPAGGSNVSGTAVLSAEGGGTRVTLEVVGLATGSSATAALHAGACASPSASAAALPALSTGANGTATATGLILFRASDPVALADIADGAHSIVVAGLNGIVACGIIPSLGASAGSNGLPATGAAPSWLLAGLLLGAGLLAAGAGLWLRRSLRYRLMLGILLVLVSLAEQRTQTATAQGTTYTDPFAYCAGVGTIDAPDARYAGSNVPEAIARGLRAATQAAPDAPLDRFINGSSWRCMDGTVYACTVGANLPCLEQANTSQTPTADMTTYCQANATAGTLPGFVTGRATVYEWSCENGVATPGRQVMQADARGFLANIWYAISPRGAGVQTMPRTGGAGIFGDRTGALVVLGAMIALLGLLVRRRSVVD